jgi:hypothetical protein
LRQIFPSAPVFNYFPKVSLGLHSGFRIAMLEVRGKTIVEGESNAKVVLLTE